MIKAIKWTVLGLVVTGSLGFLLFGSHLGSYFGTMTNSLRESVRDRVPVDFEIKRAEKLVQEIAPEIEDCKRDVARAEVELEHLVTEVQYLNGVVMKQERKLKESVVPVDRHQLSAYTASSKQAAGKRKQLLLARSFDSFKNNSALLKGKKSLIERQTRAVEAARVRLDAVRTEKVGLEHTILTLKAQKRHLDAMAASSTRFDLDDSALSKAKEVLQQVRMRLDVAQKMIEDDMFFAGEQEISSDPDRDILKDIREHFSQTESLETTEELDVAAQSNI